MDRISQLENLRKCLSKKQSSLNTLLNELNWTTENLLKDSHTNSVGKPKTLEKFDKNDEPLFPESFEWDNSTVIDDKILEEILKQTIQEDTPNNFQTKIAVANKFSDLQVNLTRDQRLAIYEYVVNNTIKLPEPQLPISLPSKNDDEQKLSFAEILAIKKDLKRRTRKYRTTKTPPLSLTEELRNLIELQMQALIQYLSEQNPGKNEKDSRKSSEPQAHCSKKMKISSSGSKHRHHHQKSDKKKKRSKSSKSSHKSRSHHKDHKHHKSHRRSRSST